MIHWNAHDPGPTGRKGPDFGAPTSVGLFLLLLLLRVPLMEPRDGWMLQEKRSEEAETEAHDKACVNDDWQQESQDVIAKTCHQPRSTWGKWGSRPSME